MRRTVVLEGKKATFTLNGLIYTVIAPDQSTVEVGDSIRVSPTSKCDYSKKVWEFRVRGDRIKEFEVWPGELVGETPIFHRK